jgi:hypothetical protein
LRELLRNFFEYIFTFLHFALCRRAQKLSSKTGMAALDEVLAPNPRNRLHDQHPQPPASFQSRQRNSPFCRGSILDADPSA